MNRNILRIPRLLGPTKFKYTSLLAFAVVSRISLFTSSGMATETQTAAASSESISAAYITCGSLEEAKKLSHGLVSSKLAACVNIIPNIISVYEWEGRVNEDPEYLLMLKTRTSRVNDVSAFIRENHSYDVAEVISVKIENGNPPYLDWVLNTVPLKAT